MARSKNKKRATSSAPINVEEGTDDGINAESTQSKPVNMDGETTSVDLDDSKEGDKREMINSEGTDDGIYAESPQSKPVNMDEETTSVDPDESKEGDKKEKINDEGTDDGINAESTESEPVNMDEETTSLDLDESKEGDEKEKINNEGTGDGINTESTQSEPVNMDEETTLVDLDESKVGDKKEINSEGKEVTATPDIIPEGEKVEEGDEKEEAEDNVKVGSASKKRARRKRRKKAVANTATSGDESTEGNKKEKINNEGTDVGINAESTQSEPFNMDEETALVDLDESKSGDKKENINAEGKEETATPDIIPEGEKVEEGDQKEEAEDNVKVGSTSKKRSRRKRRKKAVANTATSDDDNKLNGANIPGTTAAEKRDLKADGMGLIFMCNAKTKKDCFKYNVLGLPESKKDMVAKVYKGMRLFLFDVDSKLMYGIYKAASPGGYNIEPKAFKSKFPSQVRFTILNDFSPLPEQKFKAAIKGNYYGKNKFNCQLSSEQVKNLCKLFRSAGKISKKRHPTEATRDEPLPSSTDRKRKRRQPRERLRRRYAIGERDRSIHRGEDLYAREAYASLPPQLGAMPPPPPPPPSYAYDRAVDDYYYTRVPPPLPLELRDQRISNLEMRPRGSIEYHDPYNLYREPLPYRESLYPATLPASAYAPPLYRRY